MADTQNFKVPPEGASEMAEALGRVWANAFAQAYCTISDELEELREKYDCQLPLPDVQSAATAVADQVMVHYRKTHSTHLTNGASPVASRDKPDRDYYCISHGAYHPIDFQCPRELSHQQG